MPRPFLIARYVFFGKLSISVTVTSLTESLSLLALIVNLNLLNLVFAAWNANVAVAAGLSCMLDRVDA
jgi:hypothetical protein